MHNSLKPSELPTKTAFCCFIHVLLKTAGDSPRLQNNPTEVRRPKKEKKSTHTLKNLKSQDESSASNLVKKKQGKRFGHMLPIFNAKLTIVESVQAF